MLSKIGGRKFTFILIALATGTAIELFTARGITESYMYLLLGLASVFTAGNAVVNTKAISAQSSVSEPASERVQELESSTGLAVDTLKSDIEAVKSALSQIESVCGQSFDQVAGRLDQQDKAIKALLEFKST